MTFTGRRFFLSWILLVHAQANNIVQQHAFRDPDADDMLFTQSVIFDAQVANRIGCGVVCANSPDCVTFTFTPVTSTFGKCRGKLTAFYKEKE
nr:hypothetical protein BaRGS_025840 [Batillaria attramentaria]